LGVPRRRAIEFDGLGQAGRWEVMNTETMMSDGRGKAPRRIEDYALLSSCETAALVGRNGSIVWLCWPRFDSGACFAALLGGADHGRWLIAPRDPQASVTRRYLDGSLILVTSFETTEGAVELIDFMPIRDGHSGLIRLVRGVRGRVELRTELNLRFEYGSVVPWVERLDQGGGRSATTVPNRQCCARRCRSRSKTA
jgi:GH15 family glucan-1,4-alpha-glucosidase